MNAVTKSEVVALSVNQGNLMRALRDFFSNSRLTYGTEALQNARRAGAAKVEITYSEEGKTFAIRDDGCGITDWQKLLTVAESGWNEVVMKSDAPYGIGFMSLLFAAEHVRVASNGREIKFACEEALSMEDIHVVPSEVQSGTVVEMSGLKNGLHVQTLQEKLRGFPIPVFINGIEVERPNALDAGGFADTPIGKLRLKGVEEGSYDADSVLYLQGMLIGRTCATFWRNSNNVVENVIHLDSTQFFGRLPDRETLIDADEVKAKAHKEIDSAWVEALHSIRPGLSDQDFLNVYGNAVKKLAPQMLLGINLLPQTHVVQPDNSLIDINSDGSAPWVAPAKYVSREQVQSGEVELYYLDRPESDMDSEDYNIPGWVFVGARVQNSLVVIEQLPDGHWALPFIINLVEASLPEPGVGEALEREAKLVVEFVNPNEGKQFYGNFANGHVRLCDEIRLTLHIEGQPDRVSIVTDTSFATDTDGYGDAGDIYVPRESSGADACAQISAYTSDDHWQEGDYHEDKSGIEVLVERMRLSTPQDILKNIIAKSEARQFVELRNRHFVVRFNEAGEAVVEVSHD